MRCTALLVLLAIVGVSALPANFEPVDFTDIIAYAEAQEQLWLDNIQYGKDKPYPQTTGTDGLWSTGDYNNHESWGSNYGVGSAWMLYELTGKKQKWFDEGSRLQEYFLSNQFRTNSHDVGMICMTIYGNNYKFTGNTSMEQILVNAAAALSTRYNPAVELIMSWSTRANTYQVITDNMMNLELLLVAHKLTGNATFQKIALDHARNTAKWFLREDGGSFHVLDMSVTNGRPLVRGTQQGYSAFSTWGRGHAWLVYGYAYMYKWTQLPEFKQLFEQVTQYWIDHQLPAADGSYVAVWDFDDPDKNKPRDTSASAPLLAGLLRMALTEDKPADSIYFEKAHYLMKEMSSSPYLNSTDHTWQSLLRQGSRDVPANKQNTGISWGDYYYLESITYYKEIVATL